MNGYQLIRSFGIQFIRFICTLWQGNKYCVICHSKLPFWLPQWLPHPINYQPQPIIKDLVIIGSNLKQFKCPICHCFDRERHLVLYFKALNWSFYEKDILHFAPERYLTPLILADNPHSYIPCDLVPQVETIKKIDILAIPYAENSFDIVMANHVLEHVDDDYLALSEVYRVLRKGGYAVLQTPFSQRLKHTWMDEGINTEFLRTRYYLKDDHVRLYGQDIINRFTAVGFISRMKNHHELLAEYDEKRYGINTNEPFFLFQKPH